MNPYLDTIQEGEEKEETESDLNTNHIKILIPDSVPETDPRLTLSSNGKNVLNRLKKSKQKRFLSAFRDCTQLPFFIVGTSPGRAKNGLGIFHNLYSIRSYLRSQWGIIKDMNLRNLVKSLGTGKMPRMMNEGSSYSSRPRSPKYSNEPLTFLLDEMVQHAFESRKEIHGAQSDMDKACLAMCFSGRMFDYDDETLIPNGIHSAIVGVEGSLQKDRAVCWDYTKVTSHLFDLLRLKNEVASAGLHGFNKVRLNGKMYGADPTPISNPGVHRFVNVRVYADDEGRVIYRVPLMDKEGNRVEGESTYYPGTNFYDKNLMPILGRDISHYRSIGEKDTPVPVTTCRLVDYDKED